MRQSDAASIADSVTMLAETFGRRTTEAMIAGYCIGLGGLTLQQIEAAVCRAVAECRTMPSPAELREMAGVANGKARGAIAFEIVERAVTRHGARTSVIFADPVINAVIANQGGWQRICSLPTSDFDVWFRKDFERVYAEFASMGRGSASGQLGWIDADNGTRGHAGHVRPPTLIECPDLAHSSPSLRAMEAAIRSKPHLLPAAPVKQLPRREKPETGMVPVGDLVAQTAARMPRLPGGGE